MTNTTIKRITESTTTSEKEIEKYLVGEVAKMGGKALKYTNANSAGYPDRICLLPGGKMFWVELKSKGKKPRAIQSIRIEELRLLGQMVYVADSKEMVDLILKKEYEIQSPPIPD